MSHRLAWLSSDTSKASFPPLDHALNDPDGLLAAGGDLSVSRLLSAYELGIFPWYEEGQPVLWWSPNPRTLLPTDQFHCSRSLRRTLKRKGFTVSFNRAFDAVIRQCAKTRAGQSGTWITNDMQAAYLQMFQQGFAISVECWLDGVLAGGLYGVAIDRMIYGESMFSSEADASKTVLFTLCQQMRTLDMPWLDCQVASPHLSTLGAQSIPRTEFKDILARQVNSRLPGRPLFPAEHVEPLNFLV